MDAVKKKWDNLYLGLVIGLFAPMLGFWGFFFSKFKNALTITEYIQYLGIQKSLLTGVISASLVANAAFFTLFVNTHRDHSAKGVFIVTIIYVVIALVLKYKFS